MTRLNFRLKEWPPQTTWVSDAARAVWAPRIQRISNAWLEVERAAVVARVKASALQTVEDSRLPAFISDIARRGLVALPLGRMANPVGYASAASATTGEGAYRVVVTRQEFARDWALAWERQDNQAMGELLGYPACCREFFERVWVKERWFDTTVPMAQGAKGLIQGDKYCNILWRWHGVRGVSHLPCSFNCADTRVLGKQLMHVFEEVDKAAAGWLFDVLRWPLRYTSLHGIAEITTPIHRTAVATDALAEKVTVDLAGEVYPDEGARGNSHPHRRQGGSDSKPQTLAFVRHKPTEQNPADNGFGSPQAQNNAHLIVLSALVGRVYQNVVDVGCGDGTLVRRVPAVIHRGIEVDPQRARLAELRLGVSNCARSMLSPMALRFVEEADLVLLMPGRLIEAGVGNPVLPLLRGKELLVYAYGDWLTQYNGLENLVKAAGITPKWLGPIQVGPGVQAGRILCEAAEQASSVPHRLWPTPTTS